MREEPSDSPTQFDSANPEVTQPDLRAHAENEGSQESGSGSVKDPILPSKSKDSQSGRRKRRRKSVTTEVGGAGSRLHSFYNILEGITEGVIYLMAVFTIWAFGSVYTLTKDWFGRPDWAAWWMTIAGLVLFGIWILKAVLRNFMGVQVGRWDGQGFHSGKSAWHKLVWNWGLFALGFAVVGYTFLSAWNARADYLNSAWMFEYRENYISWLPHSYDVNWTWRAFSENAGLFAAFWAIRDWLLGQTPHEAAEQLRLQERHGRRSSRPTPFIPARLTRLLWVVCINAGLVGIEGILQRLSGTGKVLWIVEPMRNKNAIAQFGPYPYRGNGAQFFNLLWPVCLGFWWSLKRTEDAYRKYGKYDHSTAHPILIPTIIILMICPVVTTSRGGAVLMGVNLVVCAFLLLKSAETRSWKSIGWVGSLLTLTLVGSTYLGWDALSERLESSGLESEGRVIARENAKEMLEEYFWLGSGPKTYGSLVDYYVGDLSESVTFFNLHDDWLETLITYGVIGGSLVFIGLALLLSYWAVGAGGAPVDWKFALFVLAGMGSCLAHARFDFPFQVYSILFYFILLGAIVTSISRPRLIAK